ncbi:hypothetical protein [uncultured Rhodoblastus sp.]|uniref:hypothetical protein n=1 Tax=uncultured Rhodoblastus sp. TaxID=543037 RepID=UPI0025FC7C4E|nr:hypothetical protein [uncultured Rhodoblastus sp.]
MSEDSIIRRLESLETLVAALEQRLKQVETLCAERRDIDSTVLGAIASAHSAIRNAVRLSNPDHAGAGRDDSQ